MVNAALDVGITFFDVADVYGAPRGRSEELLGQALSGRREWAVIATKFGMDMQGVNGPDFGSRGSRRYIKTSGGIVVTSIGNRLDRPLPAASARSGNAA